MTHLYRITIKERLEDSWSDWFDGLTLAPGPEGTTLLTGSVRDQTALYGLIAKLRDLGLTLLTITPDPAATSAPDGDGSDDDHLDISETSP